MSRLYSFDRFGVIKGKLTGWLKLPLLPLPSQIRVKKLTNRGKSVDPESVEKGKPWKSLSFL